MRFTTDTIRYPLLVGVVALLITVGLGVREVGKAVATAEHPHATSSPMAVSQYLDPTGSVARIKALVKTRIPAKGHVDSHPFIDGSVTPEHIPTAIAYSFFLRALTTRDSSPEAAKRQRTYIKHVRGITSVAVRPAKDDLRPHLLSHQARTSQTNERGRPDTRICQDIRKPIDGI